MTNDNRFKLMYDPNGPGAEVFRSLSYDGRLIVSEIGLSDPRPANGGIGAWTSYGGVTSLILADSPRKLLEEVALQSGLNLNGYLLKL